MNSSKKKIFIIFLTSSFVIFLFSVSNYSKVRYKKLHNISQFISPETCSGCHEEIYRQWQNSMHNLSHKDPVYTRVALFLRKGLTNKDEIKEAELCIKCHTPIGFVTGFPRKLSDNLDITPVPGKQGIQCDYCHSATGAYQMYNNGIKLDPGQGEENPGSKRGPFKDSESDFHDSEYSGFHADSKICGTCHDVRHVVYGTKLETTYEEWKNSPYNTSKPGKRITCQGCHMYQRPGMPATGSTVRENNPGDAASGGPQRKHIFTHYFVGGNSFIPGMFKDKTKVKMAEERLKNAAALSIDSSKINKEEIIISIKNTGAGHYLPTGLTDTRQMWLEITLKDNTGRVVYSSGKLDKNGYITKNTIIYNTIFGDGKGKPVTNIAKAREILKDRRIPPLKSIKEIIKIPLRGWKYITVNVNLLYRSAPQRVLDKVLGKGKLKLPVIKMTGAKKTIKNRR